jgi:hypothetical protein
LIGHPDRNGLPPRHRRRAENEHIQRFIGNILRFLHSGGRKIDPIRVADDAV